VTKPKLEWRKPETIVERKFSCTQGGESPSGEESEARGFAHRCDRRPVVAVNDGCGARCAKHAPEGFKRPARKPAPFRRWVASSMVPVVECDVGTDNWVQLTVNTMGRHGERVARQLRVAKALAKLLNRARVVLTKWEK